MMDVIVVISTYETGSNNDYSLSFYILDDVVCIRGISQGEDIAQIHS